MKNWWIGRAERIPTACKMRKRQANENYDEAFIDGSNEDITRFGLNTREELYLTKEGINGGRLFTQMAGDRIGWWWWGHLATNGENKRSQFFTSFFTFSAILVLQKYIKLFTDYIVLHDITLYWILHYWRRINKLYSAKLILKLRSASMTGGTEQFEIDCREDADVSSDCSERSKVKRRVIVDTRCYNWTDEISIP